MKTRVLILIALSLSLPLVVLNFTNVAEAFLPSDPSRNRIIGGGNSKTHGSMTRTALLTLEKELFGVEEANLTSEMEQANNEIVGANVSVDNPPEIGGTQFDKSASHFTGENFPGAMTRIAEYKLKVRDFLNVNDVKMARFHLGQALHTLQDFYAHSNWIERGGTGPWGALGDPAQIIRRFPPKNQRTCTNCVRDECPHCVAPGTILPLTTNELTTAYYGGDDRDKEKDGNPFKCSHGGLVRLRGLLGSVVGDRRDGSALGRLSNGINKDAEFCEISPRHDLHFQAAGIAYEATLKYIREVKDLVGLAKMQKLLGFGRTMAFVIDTTGSMFDEIEAVKQKVTQIVNSRLGTPLEPSQYILMPFNDPEIGPRTVTDNVNTFKNALNNLTASGGGDCPELPYKAMLDALLLNEQSGDLIMFTDAAATTNDLNTWMQALVREAKEEKIRIHIVYSGSAFDCPTDPFYPYVAQETGGKYFEVLPEEVDDITVLADLMVRPNLQGIFAVAGSLLNLPVTYTFRLDSFLTQSSFVISGTGAANIVVRRPDNTIVQPTDIGVLYVPLSTGALYSITNPLVGTWSITLNGSGSLIAGGSVSTAPAASSKETTSTSDTDRGNYRTRTKKHSASTSELQSTQATAQNSSGQFSISVFGETKVALSSFEFLELSSGSSAHGGLFRTPGEPIAGQRSFVGAEVQFDDNATPVFEFRALDGTILQSFTMEEVIFATLDPTLTNHTRQFVGEVIVPDVPFQVYLTGTEPNGIAYQRLIPQVFRPQTLKFTAERMEDLQPGQKIIYSYQVKNFGSTGTFDVSVSDDREYVKGISPAVVTLATNESKQLKAFLEVPANAEPGTLDQIYLTGRKAGDSEFIATGSFGPVRVGRAPVLRLGTITTLPTGGDGDNFVEPGEGGSLTLPLTNIGTSEAIDIRATLTTSTPGVVVSADQSTYADLLPSASGVNSTPFVFYLPSNAPCGQIINFELSVTTFSGDGAISSLYEFSVQTGQPSSTSTTTISYTGPAVAIPDANSAGVNIPINVSGVAGTINDVNFRINGSSCSTTIGSSSVGIDHTFVSDLKLKLTSPNGLTTTLINSAGGSGNNFCSTLLDDETSNISIQSVSSANAPFSGTFKPAQSLSSHRGAGANGVWTLNVSDNVEFDIGNVRAFSLIISTTQFSCNVAPSDTTAPSCSETAYRPGPPAAGDLTVQDAGSGLAAINVVTADNVDVTVAPFTPGATGPVIVTGTLVNPSVNGSFEIESVDVAGNVTSCSRSVAAAAPQRKIVFHRNTEIYSMNPDGSGQTNLTANSFFDTHPALSPDGTKIAFASFRNSFHGVFVMNVDGSNVTRITTETNWVSYPAWSPDGTKIAYQLDQNQDIYVVNLDGTGRTNLTPDGIFSIEKAPAWSPDGTKIAFASDRAGSSNFDIYVMNANGSNVTRLTTNSGYDDGASWSPDGTKIVFASIQNFVLNIYVMNADGSNQINITNTGAGVDNREPYWSSDGTKIVFQSARGGSSFDIYVMNADGSNQTQLTTDSNQETDPAW